MLLSRFVAAMFSMAITVPTSGLVSAQDFPSRPIRIVTSAAGGGGDFISRLMAQGISGPLGASVIVDNRTGMVSIETIALAKARPGELNNS
ncbi:MAG: hypothetical protein HY525_15025 [Betaproteobacteria bacterium]|nr:hypothetical protein [Betaproteobacteria bacterium]